VGKLLTKDLVVFVKYVQKLIKAWLASKQFSALESFSFNQPIIKRLLRKGQTNDKDL